MLTIRISLPGIDALESTDPRDFALIADEDNVLIKEHSRGSVEDDTTVEVSHGLDYFPHFYAYGETSSGTYQIINGFNIFGEFRSYVDNDKLYLVNTSFGERIMKYYIFHDDMPE